MVPSFTFHVARRGAKLMGLDLFSALGFSLVDMKGAAILTVSTPWQQKWPSLFEGLGCLIAFAHQPLLNHAIKPVIQPLCRIPLALHDGVSAELKQLLDAGIIKPVDASPWVSNLVVAQKKSERTCSRDGPSHRPSITHCCTTGPPNTLQRGSLQLSSCLAVNSTFPSTCSAPHCLRDHYRGSGPLSLTSRGG